MRHTRYPIPHRCRRGLSLVELLISLTITAMLLTATMVAIDASFKAYAAAAETASTQTTTRLLTHRLLTLIRTSTAHGPLKPDATTTPPVTLDGDTISSYYLELLDASGNFLFIEYRSSLKELWVSRTPYGSTPQPAQPLLGGVTSCTFYAHRRTDSNGVLVLERATIDMTVEADDDSSLETELGEKHPIRIIASTKPRKIER